MQGVALALDFGLLGENSVCSIDENPSFGLMDFGKQVDLAFDVALNMSNPDFEGADGFVHPLKLFGVSVADSQSRCLPVVVLPQEDVVVSGQLTRAVLRIDHFQKSLLKQRTALRYNGLWIHKSPPEFARFQ